MVDYITLEELLQDKEVYEFLKNRYGDRMLCPPNAEIVPDDIPAPLESAVTDDLNSPPLSPECEEPTAPSPTYSFPSLSDDETGPAECEPSTSAPVEQPDTTTIEETAGPAPTEVKSKPTKCKKYDSDSDSDSSVERARARKKAAKEKFDHKAPPLFVRNRRKWNDIIAECYERNIKLKYVRRSQKGMKVIAATLLDCYDFGKMLHEMNIDFQILEPNPAEFAAVHYVPKEISNADIKEVILAAGIPLLSVARMECEDINYRDTHDMVILAIPSNPPSKRIFKFNPVRGFLNRLAEPQYGLIAYYCRLCQMAGHVPVACRQLPRRLTAPMERRVRNVMMYRARSRSPARKTLTPVEIALKTIRTPSQIAMQQKLSADVQLDETSSVPVATDIQVPEPSSTSPSTPVTVRQDNDPSSPDDSTVAQAGSPEPCASTANDEQTPEAKSIPYAETDAELVMRFAKVVDFEEVRKLNKLILENEGNTLGLVTVGMRYGHLLKSFADFRVFPDK